MWAAPCSRDARNISSSKDPSCWPQRRQQTQFFQRFAGRSKTCRWWGVGRVMRLPTMTWIRQRQAGGSGHPSVGIAWRQKNSRASKHLERQRCLDGLALGSCQSLRMMRPLLCTRLLDENMQSLRLRGHERHAHWHVAPPSISVQNTDTQKP